MNITQSDLLSRMLSEAESNVSESIPTATPPVMEKKTAWSCFKNSDAIPIADIPELTMDEFRCEAIRLVHSGAAVSAFFGVKEPNGETRLWTVLSEHAHSNLYALTTKVGRRYHSLTADCVPFHWFERELAEQCGVVPEGHPMLKPIRFHETYGHADAWGRKSGDILPGVTDYYQIQGEEIHEVAVGPVHAGVIEPGHFRFQCHGEEVFQLEISLGYQHRGIERRLVGGPDNATPFLVETAAGDSTIAHSTCHANVIEALSDLEPSLKAQSIRGVALELERLANHIGDLGAIANDVAFLPTASFCGRLRGDFLNMTAMICGSRFGRSLVRPGGVKFDLDAALAKAIATRLDSTFKDCVGAVELFWASPSSLGRLENTGKLTRAQAIELGLVGVAARACGVERDARFDFPTGIYRIARPIVATLPNGDVFARAYLRWLESQFSVRFIAEQLAGLPEGATRVSIGHLRPNHLCVSIVEGWRGEVCHAALTDADGRLAHYKIIDPSFHNWSGLALAMRGEEISNFPICNKSFNLSYSGHDL